jgi:hypothetical protein
MVLTAIAIVLSIAGVAVFPCWRYSAGWGYGPSAVAGLLLTFVALVSLGGKASVSDSLAARIGAPLQLAHAVPHVTPPTAWEVEAPMMSSRNAAP